MCGMYYGPVTEGEVTVYDAPAGAGTAPGSTTSAATAVAPS